MSLVLGLDIGTSSVKASIFEPETGKCLATSPIGTEEIPILVVQTGWCEQNPEDWWQATIQAIQSLPIEMVSSVVAIGIAYQMHGLVLLDDLLNPVRPAIIWSDSRAVQVGTELEAFFGHALTDVTLNSPGNFTASKLKWVAENEPEAMARSRYAVLPGDYIAAKLTGVVGTTRTGLSEMAAWDFVNHQPANDLLDYVDGGRKLVPELLLTFGEQGKVTTSASIETRLPKGASVTYRAGDQPNNALSLNVLQPGQTAATAGTSGVLYGVAEKIERDSEERVNSFLHVNSTEEVSRLGVLLCVNGTGSYYSWQRKILGIESFSALNELAESAPIGSQGIQSYPFGNGAERILGNRSPGAWIENLDFNRHSQSDFARSGMEGIVFALRFGSDVMRSIGVGQKVIRAGQANLFLSHVFGQMCSDVLNQEIELFNTDGSLGAARGAVFGMGLVKNLEDVFLGLEVIRRFSPQADKVTEYDLIFENWKEGLFSKLANL